MKRLAFISFAIALLLGMAQCKKEQPQPQSQMEPEGEKVYITLDVNGSNKAAHGEKVLIDSDGYVTFEEGDKIYVGYNGQYVGDLIYTNSKFGGTITVTETQNPQPLYFYFLGNLEPTISGNSFTVDISGQKKKLPLISMNHSEQNFSISQSRYTSELINKCALVKFEVNSNNTPNKFSIFGLNNTVTVDFGNQGVTYGQVGNGLIRTSIKETTNQTTTFSAIVLPQQAPLAEGPEGSICLGYATGKRPAFPQGIKANDYLTKNVTISSNTELIPGVFTVNANGKKVQFSKGNLQYKASTNTWRIAEFPHFYIGGTMNGQYYGTSRENLGQQSPQSPVIQSGDNLMASNNYDGWIDLFGWGTSGQYHGSTCYQPWSNSSTNADYYAFGDPNSQLEAEADWGYNTISNSTLGNWYTLSFEEWDYLLYGRGNNKFAFTDMGLFLFPDDWDWVRDDENKQFTSSGDSFVIYLPEVLILTQNGAVFLPYPGYVDNADGLYRGPNIDGFYWSSTPFDSNKAIGLKIRAENSSFVSVNSSFNFDRQLRCAVRLVREFN